MARRGGFSRRNRALDGALPRGGAGSRSGVLPEDDDEEGHGDARSHQSPLPRRQGQVGGRHEVRAGIPRVGVRGQRHARVDGAVGEPHVEAATAGTALTGLGGATGVATGRARIVLDPSDPAVRAFYTALIERGTAAGWLQLLFLTVGDRRIATSYGACFKNRLFLFKTGYDPEFSKYAPFTLLTYYSIRDGYSDGLQEVDFLGDAEPWKLEWTQAARAHDWLFVFADSVRARLLHSIKFQWLPELKRWGAGA